MGGVFIDAYNQSVNIDIAGTITARVDASNMKFVTENNMKEAKVEPIVLGWVRDKQGNVIKRPEVEVANYVTSGKRDNTQNYVIEPNIIKEGNYHKSGHNASSIVNPKGISPTVMENHGTVTATVEPKSCRIRKLTPRECFRLMDCDDEVIDKIQEAGISNSQQYKLAGNSIVVNVLYHLFRKLFTETENEENQLTLF